MNESSSMTAIPRRSLSNWLFAPFNFIAGGAALGVGVAVIAVSALLGSVSKTHFDGVLDFHTRLPAPVWVFVAEGLIDWLAMAILLLIGGLIFSKSRVRPIDVFGTQAMSRGPTLFTAAAVLLPGYERGAASLIAKATDATSAVQASPFDLLAFAVVAFIGILMTVWMVWLMYKGFSISCNVTGGKAVAVFLFAIFLGEVASKVVIVGIVFPQ